MNDLVAAPDLAVGSEIKGPVREMTIERIEWYDSAMLSSASGELRRVGSNIHTDEEYAKSLVAKRRCAMYVIDRKEEDSGPQLWLAPWTFDRDLSAQALDDETGAVLALDHPDEGYDISFSIEGKGLNKKYTGVSIARRDSDLGRDGAAWLEQIEENPVPECLVFASYEDIAKAFTGGANKPKRDDDDDGGGRDRKPSRGRDVDDDDDGDDLICDLRR